MATPRWGIASTVSEPAPLVLAFVAHYLDLGAAEVTVYLDTPAPEIAAAVGRLPGCRVVERSPGHWRQAGYRGPPIPAERQRHNAKDAYGRSGVDWLLHVDADEFLIRADEVLDRLAALEDAVDFLLIRPLERVWILGEPDGGIFDGAFRRTAPKRIDDAWLDEVYGASARFLQRGISGNGKAKSFYRTGRGIFVGVHDPSEGQGSPAQGASLPFPALLHFDGLTRAHLIAKLQRRIGQYRHWRRGPPTARRAQMEAVAAHADDPAWLDRFVSGMQVLAPHQVEALTAAKLLVRPDFDPAPALRRWFPDHEVDLSAAHFDTLSLDQLRTSTLQRAADELVSLGGRTLRRLGAVRR